MRPMILAIALSAAACAGEGDDDLPGGTCTCPEQINISLVTRNGADYDIEAALTAQTTCYGEGFELSPRVTTPGTYEDVVVTAYEDGPGVSCQARIVVEEAYPFVNERIESTRLEGADTIAVVAWELNPVNAPDTVRIFFDPGDGSWAMSTVAADAGTYELPPLLGASGTVALDAVAAGTTVGRSMDLTITALPTAGVL